MKKHETPKIIIIDPAPILMINTINKIVKYILKLPVP